MHSTSIHVDSPDIFVRLSVVTGQITVSDGGMGWRKIWDRGGE